MLTCKGAVRVGSEEGQVQPGEARRSFDEATTVFGDPLATTVADLDHSPIERRLLTTGTSEQQRVVIIWHTETDDAIRIIGARVAAPRERRIYESGQ